MFFFVTEKISNEDIKDITETAQLLSIDIKELCNDENVSTFEKPSYGSQDNVKSVVDVSQVRGQKGRKESTLDTSENMYDESTESVCDTLMKMIDDDIDCIENNPLEIQNIEMANQRKETVVSVRVTKRKLSDVSKTRYCKY